MIKLIVNADDFGLSRGVNYGIIDAHIQGIVNSTTTLVNMPAFEHAIELAKRNPRLGVGIHLTLTCGGPVSNHVPSLVDEKGAFRIDKMMERNQDFSLEEVEREWDAQIQRFLSVGLTPTHLDSHHHVHGWSVLFPVIQSLSKKYQLPVRNLFGNARKDSLEIDTFTDLFSDEFYDIQVEDHFFTDLERKVVGYDSVEVMCHPAYIDRDLQQQSSYWQQRLEEFNILTQVKLPDVFMLV